MAGEKTEKATPKKRRDERKKGNTFSSKDLVTSAFLLIVFYSLRALAPYMFMMIKDFMQDTISEPMPVTMTLTQEIAGNLFLKTGFVLLSMSLPLLLISAFVSVVFTGAQTRFLISGDPLKFKLNRLNPIEGFKKMFSLKSLVEVVKNILKIIVIAYILYREVLSKMPDFPTLMNLSMEQSIIFIGDSVIGLVTTIGMIFIAVGILDYTYQWWDYEKNLKMSKDEIKQEYKQLEGNPEIKGKIKQKQREMSRRRMMQEVPTADVVIRNPTHYAIALKYDPKIASAPVVVAMGQDLIALKIIEIAEDAGVHIVEDRPLARAMYEICKLGVDIPPEFYEPVVAILVMFYDKNGKKKEKLNTAPPARRNTDMQGQRVV